MKELAPTGDGWRQLKLMPLHSPQVLQGDANLLVKEIIDAIPRASLNLAFVDPLNLGQLRFETIRCLAERRTDLILFLPDHIDALRNVDVYKRSPDSNLSVFLGTRDWEPALDSAPRHEWTSILTGVLKDQLRLLGYGHFAEQRIRRTDGVPLYKLVFASGSPRGAQIWRGVSRKHADGQRQMFD